MYRTNAQSRLLEEAFLRAGLPYRLVGAQRFYGRREIKDMIAYLRLVMNPADEVSLMRVINVPARGIGDKALVALQVTARQAQASAGQVLLELSEQGKESPYWAQVGRSAALLADFGAMLAGWRASAETLPLPALFGRMLDDLSYEEYVNDGTEEGRSRWENVRGAAPAGLRVRRARADRFPGKPGAGLRPGHHPGGSRSADPADPARRQGAGIPHGFHRRAG